MDLYIFCFCLKTAKGALNRIEAAGLRVCLYSLPMLFSQSISLSCLKHLLAPQRWTQSRIEFSCWSPIEMKECSSWKQKLAFCFFLAVVLLHCATLANACHSRRIGEAYYCLILCQLKRNRVLNRRYIYGCKYKWIVFSVASWQIHRISQDLASFHQVLSAVVKSV